MLNRLVAERLAQGHSAAAQVAQGLPLVLVERSSATQTERREQADWTVALWAESMEPPGDRLDQIVLWAQAVIDLWASLASRRSMHLYPALSLQDCCLRARHFQACYSQTRHFQTRLLGVLLVRSHHSAADLLLERLALPQVFLAP